MKTIELKSFDETILHCTLWDEATNPKAVVQLCHGMGEYAMKYDRFARYLNSQGYIVFADDHRGHGYTEDEKNRGHHDGFMFGDTLKDLLFIHKYLKEQYNLPQIFIGHSYGSFLGQAFYQQSTDVKAVILLGSAKIPNCLSAMGMAILYLLYLIKKDWRPKFINSVSDKLFNLKYKGEKGACLWITRDNTRRQAFIEDPLCGVNMSVNFIFSMLKGIYQTNRKENTAKINRNTPLAILSGDMDPIGGWGKKVIKLYKFYKKQGVKDLFFKLYPGARHELINEINYEEVFNDINEFILKCLSK